MKTLAFLWALLSVAALAEHPENNRLPPAVEYAIDRATEITMYSLNPKLILPPERQGPVFDGYIILGSVTLSSPAELDLVRKTIREGLAAYDDLHYTCCFNPRHGFRFRTGAKTFEIVVCYECTKMIVNINGVGIGRNLGVTGRPTVFDAILKAHGVALPPPAVLK